MLPPAALPASTLFVGVDIAAKTATATWTTDGPTAPRPVTIEQTPHGYGLLHAQLQATGHPPATTLVVMEATGTYWITLAMTLVAFGYAVSVINPKQAHNFAKALLKRAKTDPVDAQMLAQLAARLQCGRHRQQSILNCSNGSRTAMPWSRCARKCGINYMRWANNRSWSRASGCTWNTSSCSCRPKSAR